jgi:hypothetical protein
MINLEKTTYAGWPNCLKLSNDTIELIVTTEVGPRILHFGFKGEEQNIMYLDPKTAGKTGGDEWLPYGGHRFWHAPEIMPRTYVPDNSPVAHDWDGKVLRLVPDVEQPTGMQKIIEIQMHADAPTVSVNHCLVNHGPWDVTAAPWGLTVLAAGGTALIPQEPFVPFPDALLPGRPLVLWQYTDMADARFTWASRYVAMRQDSARENPLKFGVRSTPSWGAYILGDVAFIKMTTLDPDATYPDFGCNWEAYTDSKFLELESLGALQKIPAQGGQVEHEEEWSLAKVSNPGNLDEAFQQVQDLTAAAV